MSGWAAMGQGIADFADDVIGYQLNNNSFARQRRALNLQYDQAEQHQPQIIKANFDARMAGFEKHGIHPLFGLGGSAGSAPSFSMPGQSRTGSHMTDGMANLMQFILASKQLDVKKDQQSKQAFDSAMRVIDNKIGNDNAVKMTGELAKEAKKTGSAIAHKVDLERDTSTQDLVEIKPAEQLTHAVGDKSVNPADVSLKRKLYTSNNQWLWIPNVQELDSLMEEPTSALGMIAALNPNMTMSQIKRQLQGLGYEFQEAKEVKDKWMTTFKAPFNLFTIKKKVPFKSRGRYPR